MVCSQPTSSCYTNKCNKCPGTEKIIALLREQLEDRHISHVKCSMWTATDRATLLTQTLSIDEFLSELDSKF